MPRTISCFSSCWAIKKHSTQPAASGTFNTVCIPIQMSGGYEMTNLLFLLSSQRRKNFSINSFLLNKMFFKCYLHRQHSFIRQKRGLILLLILPSKFTPKTTGRVSIRNNLFPLYTQTLEAWGGRGRLLLLCFYSDLIVQYFSSALFKEFTADI